MALGQQLAAQAPGPQPAGRHRLRGAGDPDGDDREVVRRGQDGRPAADPARAAAARPRPLRVQEQAPALVEQRVEVAAVLGQPAAALALDRHRVEDERDRRRDEAVAVEVVGRRRHRRALAQLARERREDDRRVHVAGVVGDEDDRRGDGAELLPAGGAARGVVVHQRVEHEPHEVLAHEARRRRARPREVELGRGRAQLSPLLGSILGRVGDAALPGALTAERQHRPRYPRA